MHNEQDIPATSSESMFSLLSMKMSGSDAAAVPLVCYCHCLDHHLKSNPQHPPTTRHFYQEEGNLELVPSDFEPTKEISSAMLNSAMSAFEEEIV